MEWADRARLGGLEAVLSPNGAGRRNAWIHGVHSYAASLAERCLPRKARIVDFGCGNGRFSRYFAAKGHRVLGTEITAEMLTEARATCPPVLCEFAQTDGIRLPVRDGSVDGIWCCAVLRYSLLVADPAYDDIAAEMFRALRPGGCVFNCEMYVDVPPRRFIDGFERAGFHTNRVSVLQRYGKLLERRLEKAAASDGLTTRLARTNAWLRATLDNPERRVEGLRDYFFVWRKPTTERNGAQGRN